jgi:exodeoxyribonuclease-3
MKIATWNINGIRARIDRLTGWLAEHEPDVLCLQETKTEDAKFPLGEIAMQGYRAHFTGEKSYNGVAILTRATATGLTVGLPGDESDKQARFVSAVIDGVRYASVYVPNGKSVESESYSYKLRFYERLTSWAREVTKDGTPLVLAGDYNVAPEDRDVYDPAEFAGSILTTPPERAALDALLSVGLVDGLRRARPDDVVYTWWDYRMLGFPKNKGVRIDHVLLTDGLASRLTSVTVDREARKGTQPSDHAPVVAIIDGSL